MVASLIVLGGAVGDRRAGSADDAAAAASTCSQPDRDRAERGSAEAAWMTLRLRGRQGHRRRDRRPLGIVMGRSAVGRIFCPWVNVLSAPISALVPIIMVIFGLGQTTIILTVVLFAIWIIVLDAAVGVRPSRRSLEMARSFGASAPTWQGAAAGGAAGDPCRRAPARDPRRQGRHHRPAARVDRRLRRALAKLYGSRFDGGFLGAARRLRLRVPARRGRSPGSSAASTITPRADASSPRRGRRMSILSTAATAFARFPGPGPAV